MKDRSHSLGGLPPNLLLRVDDHCGRFEAELQSGKRPRLEDYLVEQTAPEYKVLLQELILIDAEYRRQAGEVPRAAEYAGRFPTVETSWLENNIERPAPLEQTPKRAVVPRSPVAKDFVRLHCPHCRNPIELVTAPGHTEIQCPSCGSSFCLEEVSTTGWDPRYGQKLGNFQIIDKVGQGAFGTVYKARDLALDRLVAVKVPRAGNWDGPQDQERFLREARSAAQLRHPSIVTVHEVGQSDEISYLVSDFVSGITLADWLSDGGPSFKEAAELIAQLGDALQYAHDQGVVHRDVKPSNIMLELMSDSLEAPKKNDPAKTTRPPLARYQPRIMDFGLAKREAGEITMTIDGQVLGTPAYMSPEQAKGEAHKVDGRSDVYSLGVIFYQLLTGALPFRGTKQMLLHQVLHDEPSSPRRLNEKVPRDLETICLQAMAKEPARRYQRAGDLGDDLRRFLHGEPILARPPGGLERMVKWIQRRPALAASYGLFVLVLALSLAGGMAARLWREAEQARDQADKSLKGEKEAKQLLVEALTGEKMAKLLAEKLLQVAEQARSQAEQERDQAGKSLKREKEVKQLLEAALIIGFDPQKQDGFAVKERQSAAASILQEAAKSLRNAGEFYKTSNDAEKAYYYLERAGKWLNSKAKYEIPDWTLFQDTSKVELAMAALLKPNPNWELGTDMANQLLRRPGNLGDTERKFLRLVTAASYKAIRDEIRSSSGTEKIIPIAAWQAPLNQAVALAETAGPERHTMLLAAKSWLLLYQSRLDPGKRMTLLNRAYVTLEQAQKLNKDEHLPEVLHLRSVISLELGNYVYAKDKRDEIWKKYLMDASEFAETCSKDFPDYERGAVQLALGHARENLAYISKTDEDTNYTRAEEAFTAAIKKTPEPWAEPWVARGRALHRWSKFKSGNKADIDLTTQALVEVTKLREGALADLTESLKQNPSVSAKAEAHYWIGIISRQVNKLQKAEEEFELALKDRQDIRPDISLSALQQLADLLLDEGRRLKQDKKPKEAEKKAEQARKYIDGFSTLDESFESYQSGDILANWGSLVLVAEYDQKPRELTAKRAADILKQALPKRDAKNATPYQVRLLNKYVDIQLELEKGDKKKNLVKQNLVDDMYYALECLKGDQFSSHDYSNLKAETYYMAARARVEGTKNLSIEHRAEAVNQLRKAVKFGESHSQLLLFRTNLASHLYELMKMDERNREVYREESLKGLDEALKMLLQAKDRSAIQKYREQIKEYKSAN